MAAVLQVRMQADGRLVALGKIAAPRYSVRLFCLAEYVCV